MGEAGHRQQHTIFKKLLNVHAFLYVCVFTWHILLRLTISTLIHLNSISGDHSSPSPSRLHHPCVMMSQIHAPTCPMSRYVGIDLPSLDTSPRFIVGYPSCVIHSIAWSEVCVESLPGSRNCALCCLFLLSLVQRSWMPSVLVGATIPPIPKSLATPCHALGTSANGDLIHLYHYWLVRP